MINAVCLLWGKHMACLLKQAEQNNLYNFISRELKGLLVKAHCTLNNLTTEYIFLVSCFLFPLG